MVLVALPSRLIQGLSATPGAGAHFGQSQLVVQHRQNQMLRALAHGALHQGAADARQVQIGQGSVQGHLKIAQGIDHGAVQVNDGGRQIQRLQQHQAKATRI